MMKLKKTATLLMTFILLAVSLSSCGSENVYEDEDIELIEPVSATLNYSVAAYRNLYSYKVYSSYITPEVTELSFESSSTFKEIVKMPGTTVKKGDYIALGDTEKTNEAIEAKEEEIADLKEDHEDNDAEINKSLSEKESDYSYYGEIVSNFESMTEAEAKAYTNYKSEYAKYDSLFRNASLSVDRLKESLKESDELFALDLSYKEAELLKLKDTKNKSCLVADSEGTVVAMKLLNAGDYVDKHSNVVAIGDMDQKLVKTDFVSKSTISKAVEIYALVNGKNYNAEYQEMTNTEYNRIYEENGVVYTTFVIDDPNNELTAGDFVSIVIVSLKDEEVLTVPKDAVSYDENGSFVYLYDGTDKVKTSVKTGDKDTLFTEILSGIKEGDKVISEYSSDTVSNTYTVTKGDINSEFKGSGYLYYSDTTWLTNELNYATMYLDEVCVAKYEPFEKGQVIAKVHTDVDSIEISRKERQIERANEELKELEDNNDSKGSNDKAIKQKKEYIESLTEVYEDMKAEATVTEIKAPYSGFVTDIITFEAGDIVGKGGNIIQISSGDSSYLYVEDKNHQLTYGLTAEIEYTSSNDHEKKTVEGTVVTVFYSSLSQELQSDYALILVPKEYIADMASSNIVSSGWWARSSFQVSVKTRVTENVLLVPKKAVNDSNGYTYVTVKDSNGNYTETGFIAGGSDSQYYWVAEGLSEGVEVCSD